MRGWWRRWSRRIRERGLPLRIVVIGYTDRESRHQAADQVLTIHGPYRRDEIEALFDHYRIALLAFPTIWPETFSYTLSEGWPAGRPALVPRGARCASGYSRPAQGGSWKGGRMSMRSSIKCWR